MDKIINRFSGLLSIVSTILMLLDKENIINRICAILCITIFILSCIFEYISQISLDKNLYNMYFNTFHPFNKIPKLVLYYKYNKNRNSFVAKNIEIINTIEYVENNQPWNFTRTIKFEACNKYKKTNEIYIYALTDLGDLKLDNCFLNIKTSKYKHEKIRIEKVEENNSIYLFRFLVPDISIQRKEDFTGEFVLKYQNGFDFKQKSEVFLFYPKSFCKKILNLNLSVEYKNFPDEIQFEKIYKNIGVYSTKKRGPEPFTPLNSVNTWPFQISKNIIKKHMNHVIFILFRK